MSEIRLGSLIESAAERDAIHVAVVPAVASEMLRPGQRVGQVAGNEFGPSSSVIGIVDPYLTDVVPKGSRFWLMLLPNSVTGMRHHWSHPLFDAEHFDERADSVAWLKKQAEYFSMSYEDMVSEYSPLVNGDYIIEYDSEDWRDHWYSIQDEFWRHYEIVTGRKVKEEDKGGFSCSC